MNPEMNTHIKNALKKGIRLDGRKLDEVRDISIETGIVSTAEGSAKVKFGDAEAIVGVKMSVEKPFPDSPEDGILMVNAELLPLSNPEFESGPPSIDSIEISRVVDRGIRESKAVNTKKLCLEKGEKSWTIAVDISPINYDGNLIDIGGMGAMVALKNARFPTLTEHGVDYHKLTDQKVDINHYPLPVTVYRIGETLLVDPTEEEEKLVEARLTVTSISDTKICAMQKGGDMPLTEKDIEEMIEMSLKVGKKLRKKLEEH